jgi:hypothetical protein
MKKDESCYKVIWNQKTLASRGFFFYNGLGQEIPALPSIKALYPGCPERQQEVTNE